MVEFWFFYRADGEIYHYVVNNANESKKQVCGHIWEKKQLGYRFFRQHVVDNKYIVDFLCRSKKLVIECDGGQHSDCLDDIIRDDYLKRQGYKILRFGNNDILSNLDGCLLIIMQELEKDL